jgi:SAM-dependent methyltransferase
MADPALRASFGAFMRKLRRANAPAPSPIPAAPISDGPAINPQPINPHPIDARMLGLRDAVLSGWYRQETDELFTGFPIAADDVVLDVGCGLGANATFCGMRGAEVIFADIDPAMVAATERSLRATKARALTPIVGAADPLPLADGVASKIISTEVIEHVEDPARFLGELVRVGRPGARYLLTVPDPLQERLQRQVAPAAFFERPDPARPTIAGLCGGHLRVIERDEFERLVVQAGLVVERHEYFGFYWSIWFALFWNCGVDFSAPDHPLLENWARTWQTLLDMPGGGELKQTLDRFMPKSQLILAYKP